MVARNNYLIDNDSVTGAAITVAAGVYNFAVDGTFSGATITLKALSPDGSSWIAIDSTCAITAEGMVNVELPSGRYRAEVSGGPPSNIYATLRLAGRS